MTIAEKLAEGVAGGELVGLLHRRLKNLRSEIVDDAAATLRQWETDLGPADPGPEQASFRHSMENLAHYLALRKRDLTAEQEALSQLGLSSLGRSESHVLATLDAVIEALTALAEGARGAPRAITRRAPVIEARRDAMFGADPTGPETRILVTLPTAAAEQAALVEAMVMAGASAVRINCAHDGPEAWRRMAAHARVAGRKAGRPVPVLMDLAGPKVRTLGVSAPEAYLAREKPKKLAKLRAAGIDPASRGPRLLKGDVIVLRSAPAADTERVEAVVSHAALVEALAPGARVVFDDGKLAGTVLAVGNGGAEVEITDVRAKGRRLAPRKGVSLPGVALDIPALSAEDLAALEVVATEADMVGLSFVQTPADIRALRAALRDCLPQGHPAPGVVLKIETGRAVRNLPWLIVEAGRTGPVAVMIARGDLAVDIGLARMSEIQEEILWICEAAEVPVIWATQVLEGLTKDGHATRAEATDAAMGQRAECVMLNKGEYAVEAVAFLSRVLRRMDRHQVKKSPRLAQLRAWYGAQDP